MAGKTKVPTTANPCFEFSGPFSIGFKSIFERRRRHPAVCVIVFTWSLDHSNFDFVILGFGIRHSPISP